MKSSGQGKGGKGNLLSFPEIQQKGQDGNRGVNMAAGGQDGSRRAEESLKNAQTKHKR